jgi:hypothetical protein
MKKNIGRGIAGIALVLTIALAACPTGGGGGDGVPPASTPLEHTLTSGDVLIKITETNTQPAAKAAISPKTGNFYWVFLAAALINRGTVTVNGSAIQFSGGFTLNLSGGNYTFTGSIPNSQGSPLTGLGPFTGSSTSSTSGGGGVAGNIIGKWTGPDKKAVSFTATEFTFDLGSGGQFKGTYTSSGSTYTMKITSATGDEIAQLFNGATIASTVDWIDANTLTISNQFTSGPETYTRVK